MKNAKKYFYNPQSSSLGGGIKNNSSTVGSSFINNRNRCIREFDLESRIFLNSKLPRKQSIIEHMRKNDFLINVDKKNEKLKEKKIKDNQEEEQNNREQELLEIQRNINYKEKDKNLVDVEKHLKYKSKNKDSFMDHQLHTLLSSRYTTCTTSSISLNKDCGDTLRSTTSGN
jgi:hypothetical protein